MLFDPRMMDLYLACCRVLIKEFESLEVMTSRVKQPPYQVRLSARSYRAKRRN
jgi:hypothetical protein